MITIFRPKAKIFRVLWLTLLLALVNIHGISTGFDLERNGLLKFQSSLEYSFLTILISLVPCCMLAYAISPLPSLVALDGGVFLRQSPFTWRKIVGISNSDREEKLGIICLIDEDNRKICISPGLLSSRLELIKIRKALNDSTNKLR